jgi:hypothetical protein
MLKSMSYRGRSSPTAHGLSGLFFLLEMSGIERTTITDDGHVVKRRSRDGQHVTFVAGVAGSSCPSMH